MVIKLHNYITQFININIYNFCIKLNFDSKLDFITFFLIIIFLFFILIKMFILMLYFLIKLINNLDIYYKIYKP